MGLDAVFDVKRYSGGGSHPTSTFRRVRVAKDPDHLLVNASIARDELFAIDRELASFEVRHAATGFRNDQGACRHVPGMQLHLPEPIESARGHIAEVCRGGSGAPDALRFQ